MNVNSNTFGVEKKNQENIKRLNNIINDYETKLDNKVDDLVRHMITYSKKIQDKSQLKQVKTNENNFILPQIKVPKSAQLRSKSQSRALSFINTKHKRQSSICMNMSSMMQIDENMEQKINNLKKSAAISMLKSQQNQTILGRALGNKRFLKPKVLKRQSDILPRQIRLDPFSEKNIIKAQQLDKGIINLIERGRIGKDVDIISAFEKGENILNAKQAIFYNGEEKFAKTIEPKIIQSRAPVENYSKQIRSISKINYEENNWAITMPQSDNNLRFSEKNEKVNKQNNSNKEQLQFKDNIYLKFVHFSVIENTDLKRFIFTCFELSGEIYSIFSQISHLLEKNMIEIAYVDTSRLIYLTTLMRKVQQSELVSCIVSFKNHKKIPFSQIVNVRQRKLMAIQKIQGMYKRNICRKQFLLFLKKKKVEFTIYNWLYNVKVRQNFKKLLHQHKFKTNQNFQSLQENLKINYKQIINQKHFEIHISNKIIQDKAAYKEYLNTQITRIFNFSNPHTYIIFILSEALAEQTKNYYFKIMELEQIPKFKQRVTFLSVKNYSQFASNKFKCSQKLYYDSHLIRELKQKIGSNPAYFRVSYPSKTDIQMASFFNIPIYTGKLSKLLQIEQRSSNFFRISELKTYKIQSSSIFPINLVTELLKFCENNKRHKNYIIKINECYQSSGIGLLTYPFDSLPGMYSNTAFISNNQTLSPSEFYRKLCKKGGIVQIFEESLSSLMVLGKITNEGERQILGTYDKVSYGFVNIGYLFPQMTVPQSQILQIFNSVSEKLVEINHFGEFQISLFVDQKHNIFFDKIQCYQTEVGSSLFYFKFLCDGNLNNKGQYITQIVQTYESNDHKQQQLVLNEPRHYFYLPYILHFGLSEKQTASFFQLCRIGGISFDLQNKFGSTFILLGSMKNSMGLITTAKNRETCKQLMLKSLNFILKQNSHNNSKQFMFEKQKRMQERQNILVLKERIQNL